VDANINDESPYQHHQLSKSMQILIKIDEKWKLGDKKQIARYDILQQEIISSVRKLKKRWYFQMNDYTNNR